MFKFLKIKDIKNINMSLKKSKILLKTLILLGLVWLILIKIVYILGKNKTEDFVNRGNEEFKF